MGIYSDKFFFFFSSRRRHTRCGRDWSSDVCSSDLVPKSKLEIIESDGILPGGVVALYDGRGRLETPLWLPEQQVIVFGDALTERAGVLRIWSSPWHEKRALPALRELLKLPFEQVIISHSDHDP